MPGSEQGSEPVKLGPWTEEGEEPELIWIRSEDGGWADVATVSPSGSVATWTVSHETVKGNGRCSSISQAKAAADRFLASKGYILT